MGCKKKCWFLLAVLVSLVAHVAAVPLTDLFPFGLKFGDDSLPPGDAASASVTLQQQFPFYGKSRHSVTVYTDGRLDLRVDKYSTAKIFSYSANVDTTNIGEVFYRETNDPFLLKKAAAMMLSTFPELSDATPTSLFIATWFYVGYFEGHSDKTNTFQCALATNGTVAFVTLLYVDGHMQWTASDSGSTVEVGFLDDSTYLFPPTDLTDIDARSNAGSPGKWLFRVDGQRIIPPDAGDVRSALEVEERDRRFVSGEGPTIELLEGEVSIGFEQMTLSVLESDQSIEICVVIDAQLSPGETNTVQFRLNTVDGNATNLDYVPIDEIIEVTVSTQQRECRNIIILEDKLFEYQEIFHIILCPLADQSPTNLRFTITRLYIVIIDTTVFIEGCDFIRFITLDNPVIVPQGDLIQDGTSAPEVIDIRFPFGLSPGIVEDQRFFRIAENGVITFDGSAWRLFQPVLFPSTVLTIRDRYILAPFWADHDVQTAGSVQYQVFRCPLDNEILLFVSIFIRKQFPDAAELEFLGTWMLVVHWFGVPPFGDPTLTNTYQAIAITDGRNSYAIYTYRCDLMQWGGGATVGFNAFGQPVRNEPASGSSTVHTTIACANMNGVHGVSYANILYHVGRSENPAQLDRVRCLEIYKMDQGFPLLSSSAFSCPCTWFQALFDWRFRFFNFVFTNQPFLCYISRFPTFPTFQSSVLCCYFFNFPFTLVSTGFFASSVQRFHPIFIPSQYEIFDREFREVCCGPAGLCNLFYQHRPLEDCSGYRPPFWGWFWGDPHITTIDGRRYTFNGRGEYILLRTISSDFVLQGRTEITPGPAATGATQFSAYAFGIPSTSVVEVERPVGAENFIVRYNNVDVSGNITDNIDISITRDTDDTVLSVFPSGITVLVNVSGGIPDAVLTLPQTLQGLTQGLLGNYNGDDTDDFVFRNGTMLSNDADERIIFEFGQSWQITEDESLFNYPPSMSSSDFAFPDHEPQFTDEVVANADPTVVEACGNDTECIFDATQTGNISIGLATLDFDQTSQTNFLTAINNPPLLEGELSFTADADMEEVYRFTATDNDTFMVTVMDGVITNGFLEQNGSEFTFTFTIPSGRDNFADFSLGFLAEDSEGAISSLEPQLLICACVNGNCTMDGVDDTGTNTIVLNCECTEAYTGRFCEEDVDACTMMPCFEGVNCSDIPAPGVGAECGPCPEGYREFQGKCEDIDECNETMPCNQTCVNTVGSFSCECENGFMLESDNRNCADVDECMQAVNPCDQICVNTIGSFMCMCDDGFMFGPDNFTCTGPPCGTNQCTDRCANINGTAVCLCDSGRMLLSDGVTCEDINECMLSPPVCEQTCTDSPGSFMCGCASGFELQSDGRSCSDIDECMVLGAAACTIDEQVCMNTVGSFFCMCPPGTALVDGECQVASIMFLETEFPVMESNGSFPVCISISGGLPETAILRLSTVANTATAGADYAPIDNQAIVFTTSPDQVCVSICVINDMLVEATEQFRLTLTAPLIGTNLVLVNSGATVFLRDSSVVNIGFLAPSYMIDECASCPVVVRIGMSGSDLQRNVSFTLSTQDDTAIGNADYDPVTQELTFGPMLPSEIEFEITILSDNITEEEEQFIVLLETSDSSIFLSTGSANVTIVDTSVVTAEFEQCSYDVNENSLNVSVCVRLSGQRARNHVVHVQTRDITATAPADYTAVNIYLEFPPGMDVRCTDIEVVDDVLQESQEFFAVILSSSDQSVNILKTLGVIEIIDTSDPIVIVFQQPSYTFSEATPSATVAVDVSGIPPGIGVTVRLFTVDGSAEAGQDYVAVDQSTFITTDGSINLTVPINNDELLEDPSEEFEVSVTAETSVTGVPLEKREDSISVFINDDDGASAALVETSFEITETEASRNLAVYVCVNLTGNTAVDVSVVLSTESGTAEGDEDFPDVSNPLTFPPGSGSQIECSAFAITDDGITEAEENFNIVLNSSDHHVDITVDEATVVITDDDNVSIGFAETTFTANENDGVVTLLIDITGETSRNLIISISTKDGSATAGEDYVAINSQAIELTPDSLAEQVQVNITLNDDDVLEQMLEEFTVCLETTDSGVVFTTNTTTVLIVEDDGPVVRFAQEVYNGTEGGDATVCLTLNGQADFNITVTLTSMNGDAMAGLDYEQVNEDLIFVTGEVFVCQDIALLTDNILENTESFFVSLTSVLPEVMIPFPNAEVEILDANVADISFIQETYTVNEGGGEVEFVCARAVPPLQFERDVIVTFATRNGTAQDPMDYVGFSGTSVFGGSGVLLCVDFGSDNFPIVDDNDFEETEVFFLDLNSDDPAFEPSVPTATIFIIDDDNTCGRPPNECDSNAECRRTTQSGPFECICNQGFTGDGFTCTVILPVVMFVNNTPHVDNTTLTLTVQFNENEGVQSSMCRLGRRAERDCTGGSFVDPNLPANKVLPFNFRITSTAFDGNTTAEITRDISIGGRNSCALNIHNDGQLGATYTGLTSFMVEWEAAGPLESFTCELTVTEVGSTILIQRVACILESRTETADLPSIHRRVGLVQMTGSIFLQPVQKVKQGSSPYMSGGLSPGTYSLTITPSGSFCQGNRLQPQTIEVIVPNPNP